MASLGTQFAAFLFFFPVGIRRLLCSSSLYLKNPSLYRSKIWYFNEPKWKNIDFYFLIIALPISSFSEFFIFLFISGHPTYRFAFFHQSASVSLFWALLVLIIFRETFDPFLLNESFLFVLAGIAFLVEYSVTGKGIIGLGGVVYDLSSELTIVCAFTCLILSLKPTLFFADFILSSALVFKGTWLFQAGLSLFTDTFAMKGCSQLVVLPGAANADVKCDLVEDGLRGVGLLNLLFLGHAIFVMIASFILFGLLSNYRSLRCVEATGPLLAQLESESTFTTVHPEFEIE